MEFSQVFTVLVGWVVLSVPASLIIGACLALGGKEPQPQMARVRAFAQVLDHAA